MRLIKTIRRKLFHLVKNTLGHFLVNTVLNRPLGKHNALLWNLITHFFTHNLPEFISTTHCITAQFTGNHHDLLLINHNAVSFFQNRLQFWMQVLDFLFSVLALDKSRNIVHRSRTIQ